MRVGPTHIDSVLVTAPFQGWRMDRLRDAFDGAEVIVADADDAGTIEEALRRVDVAILKGDLDERFLDAPRLRWVHCDHSGLNRSARPEVFDRGLIVTGSAGRAAPALAHHAFFFVLSLVYDAPALHEANQRRAWRDIPSYQNLIGVYGKTMGVIGLGHTGVEVAALARAFGMNVLAYRKSVAEAPDSVSKLYCADRGDTIDELLAESDFVVLTVRLTDATHHLIGRRELQLMKPTARLVNLARGPVVDEAALVEALEDGTIAGAGLDVFEQEPLPPDSPIWTAPNTVLTPHVTAEMPDLAARSLEIIVENVRRYRMGEPMLNGLAPDDVYTSDAPAGQQ